MSRPPDLSSFKIARKGAARPIEPEAVPFPGAPEADVPAGPAAAGSGRLLATTVKLDEDRYLRLQDAARPVPGRPRRRTTQDILTEALDEWLAKRGL